MVNQWSQGRFRILLVITALAGMTQGLLIPLLTTMLERRGVSSSLNGLERRFPLCGHAAYGSLRRKGGSGDRIQKGDSDRADIPRLLRVSVSAL